MSRYLQSLLETDNRQSDRSHFCPTKLRLDMDFSGVFFKLKSLKSLYLSDFGFLKLRAGYGRIFLYRRFIYHYLATVTFMFNPCWCN